MLDKKISAIKVRCIKYSSNIDYENLPLNLQKNTKQLDSTIWPIVYTTHLIVNEMDIDWMSCAEKVGFIMIGNVFPRETSGLIRNELLEKGKVAPFHFISANAGAAISTCCTTFGFKGPTLNLTMPNDDFNIAKSIAESWIIKDVVKYVFFLTTKYLNHEEFAMTNSLLSL